MSPRIPTSGRLEKLAKTIEEETSKEILSNLFQDYYNSLKGEELAKWILVMIYKLKLKLGLKKAIYILEKHGRKSCGQDFKNTIIELMKKSNSIQEFVDNLKKHYKNTFF